MSYVPCLTTSYGDAIEDAKRRMKRGERQAFCPTCERWRWSDECAHPKTAPTRKRRRP